MLKKYVDKHSEWEMKKKTSKLKNKCDQSGRSLEKIKEDDQMKAEEKIEQKQFVETIVKNLDSKGHLTETNFFIVHFNTITPPSGTQEGKHYPCEMGLVGYSIQNGLNRSFHKFLSPTQIPFGYRFEAMKKSKEIHNIPPDPNDFDKYEEDYIQIFESIKKFMSNNKFEVATLIAYVMPNHEDAANSIFKFICEKAGQSEKTFKICLLPQLLFELMKLAPGGKRGNGEKMPIDSVWTATKHLDKDSFKYLPELGCDFHEEPGINSHYCALTIARCLAFNISEICSKAFNVRMQSGRHTPPEKLGRSCAPSRVSAEIVKQAITQETKNSWGTKISPHAAPAGISPIPTGFDPNQVRLGPEAELFPGLHPELVEKRSQVEDFSQRSIGHRDSFFQSGNSHRGTLLNSASVASVVKAGESNLIEQVSQKVCMLQLPSSNDSNNQTRHHVENGFTALDSIRPIQEKVKENRKVMKEGIQACKFGGQKPAEGKEKASLKFEIQIIKQEKGLNTDILVRKDLKDNGSHNIDMDNKTKHVERQRTSNGERLESSRARLSKDENVGNLIMEKNSAETGGRDVTNSVLERCSRGLNDSVYSTGGKNAFEVRGKDVKSAIESRSVVTVPDNLNSTVGKSAFENGVKDVKLAVESRSISTVPNVLNSIVGKCEKVGQHRGRGSVINCLSNTANLTVGKSALKIRGKENKSTIEKLPVLTGLDDGVNTTVGKREKIVQEISGVGRGRGNVKVIRKGSATNRKFSSRSRSLGSVSRHEIEVMISEIKATEVEPDTPTMQLLSSQALLAIRLCGSVLTEEIPANRSALVSTIWALLLEKGLPLTINHYNALLRVHLENRHNFDPEQVLQDMKEHNLEPNRETYQCFISRYCQTGNIDGASNTLQIMKQKGFSVNENIFNSLIIGHSESGDMGRAHGMLKVMKQWGMTPSSETYLTLCCGYARHGDLSGLERTMAECRSGGIKLNDGDFLEMIFVLSEAGHKEHVAKILAMTHPEAEEFSGMAAHLVVRLVNAGHDDVAYNVVMATAENSTEEGKKVVSAEFLGQIVRLGRPVAKLMWFVNDMGEKKIHMGGLDTLVNLSIAHGNTEQALKLTEMLVAEGGKISERQLNKLLAMSKKQPGDDGSNLLSCVKLGAASGLVTPDILKKSVFPRMSTWPELIVAQLEEAGLDRSVTVTPLVEWLVGQSKTDAAATVAGIFPEHVDNRLNFLKPQQHPVIPKIVMRSPSPVPVAPTTTSTDYDSSGKSKLNPGPPPPSPIQMVALDFLSQDRIADLEHLLSVTGEADESDRCMVYFALLEAYAKHGLVDQAIHLSRAVKDERLVIPEFHETLGELIESRFTKNEYSEDMQCMPPSSGPQYNVQAWSYDPLGHTYLPVMMPTYVPPPQYYPGYYQYPTPPQLPSEAPTPDTESLASERPSSVDSSVKSEQACLHRQLKKAIAAGNPEEGLSAYNRLEQLGKVVNVTETSTLTEQLIRCDMTKEATEITKSMLARNTHPLPKIFRFLLNKLATSGAVEEMQDIGQYLNTKVKKDVSFDNRLCNAFLSAGRGAEFLDRLVVDLDTAVKAGNREMLVGVQDRFPRGGAMGLLDNHPELLDRFTMLAAKFSETGYVAPMNVLWTYHFIHQNNEKAASIWQDYVKDSNQIMFQKVCQVARATGNLSLAFGLVDQLGDAEHVTTGAKGIAYSCLLDCLCASGRHKDGWKALNEAMDKGVALQDVNRTALVRLKQGMEEMGETFPFEIHPKNAIRDEERRMSHEPSAINWNEY